MTETAPAKSGADPLQPGQKRMAYRPILGGGTSGSAYWLAVPSACGAEGKVTSGTDFFLEGTLDRRMEVEQVARRITFATTEVCNFIQRNSGGELPVQVVLPISVRGLLIKEVACAFADVLQGLNRSIRQNIILEAIGFPEKLSLDILDEVAILLYPYCRQYVARPRPSLKDFTLFANCNFAGVSLDLADKPWPIQKARPLLDEFFAAADKSRLEPWLHGVGSTAIAKAGRNVGFRYLDGVVLEDEVNANAAAAKVPDEGGIELGFEQ